MLEISSVFMSTNLNSLKLTLWWENNAELEFNTLSTRSHLHNAVDLHSLLHASAKDALHFLSKLCYATSTMSNISMFQNEPQENDIGVLCALKCDQFDPFHVYMYIPIIFPYTFSPWHLRQKQPLVALCSKLMWWLLTAGEAINQLGSPNPQFLLSQHFLPAQIILKHSLCLILHHHQRSTESLCSYQS